MGDRLKDGMCVGCGMVPLLKTDILETKDMFCTQCWPEIEKQAKRAVANRKEKHGLEGAKGNAGRITFKSSIFKR